MRLLYDEMLKGPGRWLRAAGYDTAIAGSGAADDDLLAQARAEARILLTCDRGLAGRDPAAVVLVAGEGIDEAAGELRRRLGIDWLRAPFSRCLLDDTPLREAPATTLTRLSARTRAGARSDHRLPGMRPPLLAEQPCPADARQTRPLAAG